MQFQADLGTPNRRGAARWTQVALHRRRIGWMSVLVLNGFHHKQPWEKLCENISDPPTLVQRNRFTSFTVNGLAIFQHCVEYDA